MAKCIFQKPVTMGKEMKPRFYADSASIAHAISIATNGNLCCNVFLNTAILFQAILSVRICVNYMYVNTTHNTICF